MANVNKTSQDDSILYHLRMAAISIRKATSLVFGKARAFCRSVGAVLIPTRLKKSQDSFKPPASSLNQRSITPMGPQRLSAVLKGYSFAEIDAFKGDFKLRIKEVMDDIVAIEGEKEPELYKKIQISLLHRIDDCPSLNEMLVLLNDVVPEPYQKRLCMSFLKIGRDTGANLGLSEQGRLWLESTIRNESFEELKENLFQRFKSELGQSTEWLAEGFKEYTAKERSFLHSLQMAEDIPAMVSCFDNHFEHCEQYGYLLKMKKLVEQAGYRLKALKVKVPLLAYADELSAFKEKIFPLLELIHKNEEEQIDSRSGLRKDQISALALSLMKASDINDAFAVIKQEAPSKYAKNLLTAFKEICVETGDEARLDPSIRQYLEDRENWAEDTSLDLPWSHVSEDMEMVVRLQKELLVDIDNVIQGISEACHAKADVEERVEEEESDPPGIKYVVVPYAEVRPEELPEVKALKALETRVERCVSYEDMVKEVIERAPEKYTRHLLGGLKENYQNLKDANKEPSGSREVLQVSDVASVDIDELRDFEVSLDEALALNNARDPEKKYNLNRMYVGDELKITMLKTSDDSQGEKTSDDQQDFLCDLVSQGGTKKVFKINIKGKGFAIAVPAESYQVERWDTALKETQSTEQLRQLGFNTLSYHKNVLVEIDGVTVPAIVMPLFDDLDGHIADDKSAYNLDSFIDDMVVKDQITGKELQVKEIPDEEVFFGVLQHAIREVAALVKNKIYLEPDSINYQISESGDVELFLFDLPKEIIKTDFTQDALCRAYASSLIDCFVDCMKDRYCIGFDTSHKNLKFRKKLADMINQAAIPDGFRRSRRGKKQKNKHS